MSASRSSRRRAPAARVAVRGYLAALAPDTRRELKRIRDAIRAAAPGAEETFSYHMPAFSMNGKTILWYAAWKRCFSLYPVGAAIVRANESALAGYAIAKATARFPLDAPPSSALVRRVVKARLAEMLLLLAAFVAGR